MPRTMQPMTRTDTRSNLCGAVMALSLVVGIGCGPKAEGLARPNGLCLSPSGILYVSDFHHQRIVGLDQAGKITQAFGQQGLDRDQLW
ncbi:MAG: sugar lactone lactonase YvrE, partial [Myxococcota bacterium]